MAQRADTWLVSLTMLGVNLGVWDTFTGGATDSEESKYRPGGMAEEISLGGRTSIDNVVISRYVDDWLTGMGKWIRGGCGWARCTVGRVPLRGRGVVAGPAEYYGGTLKAYRPPEIDSMGSDVAKVELEFTIDTFG